MTGLLLQNCDILQLENRQVKIIQHQDIVVIQNKISAINNHPSVNKDKEYFDEIIDCDGLLATPGFINTHTHIPMVLFRGLVEDVSVQAWFNDYIFPLESNLTPEDIYWGALLGIAEMIENGITSVADHYFFMDQVAEAIQDGGMRANLVWALFSHNGEKMLDQSCQFIQRWQGASNRRITTWLGPHAPYTTGPDYLRLCAVRAKDLGVGIHIHVSETAEQVSLSLKDFGITPIKMLEETGVLDVPTILAHCLFPSDEDIKILSDKPSGIAHAPKTYQKLGMGTTPLYKYLNAGIPVGLATDGAASSNTLDIMEQMREMVLTQKSFAADPTIMPVSEALEIAFPGSAKVMQNIDKLGDITPGKLADITLLRQDGLNVFPRYNPAANLIYSSRASDVDTVICDGKVLMLHRKLLTIDKKQVKQEISKRLERLSKQVPGKRVATYPV